MLNVRKKDGADLRWFSADRDFAYSVPRVFRNAAHAMDRPDIRRALQEEGVTNEDVLYVVGQTARIMRCIFETRVVGGIELRTEAHKKVFGTFVAQVYYALLDELVDCVKQVSSPGDTPSVPDELVEVEERMDS